MKTFKNIYLLVFLVALTTNAVMGQTSYAYQDLYSTAYANQTITATTTTQQSEMLFTGTIIPQFVMDPTAPASRLFVRKMDIAGGPVFYKIALETDCELFPSSIKETTSEEIIIAGTVRCNEPEMTTMFILILDREGNQLSLNYYDRHYLNFGEGIVYEESGLRYAEQGHNNEIIATGETRIYDTNTQSITNATIVLKTDATGNYLKHVIIPMGVISRGMTIKKMPNDQYALLMETVEAEMKPTVVVLDNDLNEVWNKTISHGPDYLFPRDLLVTDEGIVVTAMANVAAAGHSYASLIALDGGNGGINWHKSFYWRAKTDTYYPENIAQDINGDLYIAGEIQYETNSGGFEDNVFVIHTGSNGQLKKVKEYGQAGRFESVEQVTTFDNHGFAFVGTIGIFNTVGYVVKADVNGSSDCDYEAVEGQVEEISFVAVDTDLDKPEFQVNTSNPSIYMHSQDVDINRCGQGWNRSERIAPIIKEVTENISINASLNIAKNTSTVYPNPNNGSFNLVLPDLNNEAPGLIQLYNANGQLIKELNTNNSQQAYDFKDYPKGIYFLKITNGLKTESHKIMVQ